MRIRLLKRLGSWSVAASTAFFVISGLNPTPAAASCAYSLQFDGVQTGAGTNTIGSNANISHYKPRIPCQSPSAWVMIFDNGSQGLAQVGWERGNASFGSANTTYFFVQYSSASGSGNPVAVGTVPSPADTTQANKFSVWFQSGSILYTIDDNGVFNTSNPNWSSDESAFMGEVHNNDDQVPGDTNHHLRINSLLRLYNGSWHDVNALNNKSNNSAHGAGDWADAPHFNIWDKRYSSLP